MKVDYSLQYKLTDVSNPIAVPMMERSLRTILPYLPNDKLSYILEIGPGNGLLVKVLHDMGYTNVLGIEIDRELASLARNRNCPVEHIPQENLINHIAAQKTRYAFIFCIHVLEHIPREHQLSFLRAVHSALIPGGTFLCEVPNGATPIAGYWRYMDWTHQCLFTVDSLEFVLKSAGFSTAYLGEARRAVVSPRGRISHVLASIAQRVAIFVSQSIYRIHLVAELGFAGFKYPSTWAILGIGVKQVHNSAISESKWPSRSQHRAASGAIVYDTLQVD